MKAVVNKLSNIWKMKEKKSIAIRPDKHMTVVLLHNTNLKDFTSHQILGQI